MGIHEGDHELSGLRDLQGKGDKRVLANRLRGLGLENLFTVIGDNELVNEVVVPLYGFPVLVKRQDLHWMNYKGADSDDLSLGNCGGNTNPYPSNISTDISHGDPPLTKKSLWVIRRSRLQ